MNEKDFNPDNIEKVPISLVEPNEYNPKQKDTKEYQDVVDSIRINGLKQPIFVRETNDKYVIVDGEQRYTAALDLGYEEIYIYNLGNISEEEAKALTIWFEVQVPFDNVQLAPIVLELNKLDLELPYTDKEILKFKKIANLEVTPTTENDESSEDSFKTLKVLMTGEQFDVVKSAITTISENENVSEGRALELLVADGLAGYQQQNYVASSQENL